MTRIKTNKKSAATFLFPVATIIVAPLLFPAASFAQSYVSSVPALSPAVPQQVTAPAYGTASYTTAQQQAAAAAQAATRNAGSASTPPQQQTYFSSTSGAASTPASSAPYLGSETDPTSDAYKVNQLATQAQEQRALDGTVDADGTNPNFDAQSPPPDVESLQQVNQYQAKLGNTVAISDEPVSKELGVDMRKEAQKEAALSYGARGGLAKRNYQIMERMKGFETVLDRVFDFRALLIKAPSGLLIEPPIIEESRDAVVVTDNGNEAAVADKVFDINKKAKIVTAPRDWRQYLVQTWSQVPPPPRVLWPKNAKEQADWDTWVATGWKAGTDQADQIFDANVNQLTADYNGMVRYKMLLAQDMISAPFVMHDDRGVAGNNSQMRVGDSAIKITGPSQFMTRADLWKPADQ